MNDIEENKKSYKKIIALVILFITLIISFFVGVNFMLKNGKVEQIKNEILLSEIFNNCENINECDISEILKNQISYEHAKFVKTTIEKNKVEFNLEKKEYTLVYKVKNKYIDKTYAYVFYIKDDMPPFILKAECKVAAGENFNINDCVEAYDYSDGKIEITDVDYSEFDINKEGQYTVSITLKDKDNNEKKENILVTVTKKKISAINIDFKDTMIAGEKQPIKYSILPDDIDDKTVNFTTTNARAAYVYNNELIAAGEGSADICIRPNYDLEMKKCKTVTVSAKCENVYEFKYNGDHEEIIAVGYDICPGTYRFYAPSVLNYDELYFIRTSGGLSFLIHKPFINDEGKNIVVTKGQSIYVDSGILKFKLVKVK